MTEKKEYIDRGLTIENLKRFAPELYTPLINQIMEKQPAADVVEVVRCKDCKYSYWEKQTAISEVLKCGTHNGLNDEVDFCDFCSYGERKERG